MPPRRTATGAIPAIKFLFQGDPAGAAALQQQIQGLNLSSAQLDAKLLQLNNTLNAVNTGVKTAAGTFGYITGAVGGLDNSLERLNTGFLNTEGNFRRLREIAIETRSVVKQGFSTEDFVKVEEIYGKVASYGDRLKPSKEAIQGLAEASASYSRSLTGFEGRSEAMLGAAESIAKYQQILDVKPSKAFGERLGFIAKNANMSSAALAKTGENVKNLAILYQKSGIHAEKFIEQNTMLAASLSKVGIDAAALNDVLYPEKKGTEEGVIQSIILGLTGNESPLERLKIQELANKKVFNEADAMGPIFSSFFQQQGLGRASGVDVSRSEAERRLIASGRGSAEYGAIEQGLAEGKAKVTPYDSVGRNFTELNEHFKQLVQEAFPNLAQQMGSLAKGLDRFLGAVGSPLAGAIGSNPLTGGIVGAAGLSLTAGVSSGIASAVVGAIGQRMLLKQLGGTLGGQAGTVILQTAATKAAAAAATQATIQTAAVAATQVATTATGATLAASLATLPTSIAAALTMPFLALAGQIGLIIGAAIAGWKAGTWINENTNGPILGKGKELITDYASPGIVFRLPDLYRKIKETLGVGQGEGKGSAEGGTVGADVSRARTEIFKGADNAQAIWEKAYRQASRQEISKEEFKKQVEGLEKNFDGLRALDDKLLESFDRTRLYRENLVQITERETQRKDDEHAAGIERWLSSLKHRSVDSAAANLVRIKEAEAQRASDTSTPVDTNKPADTNNPVFRVPAVTGGYSKSKGETASLQQNYSKWQAQIEQAANKYGVDPKLMGALIQQESSYNPNAVGPLTKSGEKAVGLGQLMPATADDLAGPGGRNKRADPAANLDMSAKYLGQLNKMFKGDPEKILAAYNTGQGRVARLVGKYGDDWKQHLYPETKDYVPAVMANYAVLSGKQGTSAIDTKAQVAATTVPSVEEKVTTAGSLVKEANKPAMSETVAAKGGVPDYLATNRVGVLNPFTANYGGNFAEAKQPTIMASGGGAATAYSGASDNPISNPAFEGTDPLNKQMEAASLVTVKDEALIKEVQNIITLLSGPSMKGFTPMGQTNETSNSSFFDFSKVFSSATS